MTLPWPSSSHAPRAPLLALNQSTSAYPSPLKSPTPTTCHDEEHPGPQVQERPGVVMTLPWPSSSHSTRAPLLALNQSTSACLSPLKSPTPTACHELCAAALAAHTRTITNPAKNRNMNFLVMRSRTMGQFTGPVRLAKPVDEQTFYSVFTGSRPKRALASCPGAMRTERQASVALGSAVGTTPCSSTEERRVMSNRSLTRG